MYPTIGHVLPSYLLFLALGVGLGVSTAVYTARLIDPGFDLSKRFAVLVIGATPLGLFGAKIDSLIERGGYLEGFFQELSRGYRYPGGILAVIFMFMVLPQGRMGRSIWTFGDIVAPAAALAMVGVRIGCFFGGCCFGRVSSLPWAIRFPKGSLAWQEHVNRGLIRADAPAGLPVHPLQLYFALWSLALGILLLCLTRRRKYAGQVVLVYLTLENLMKFLLESLRDPPVPHLEWMSLGIAIIAAGGLTIRQWQSGQQGEPFLLQSPRESAVGRS